MAKGATGRDINDMLKELLVDGWKHGDEVMGLLEAVQLYATDSEDQVEGGGRFVPSSTPPWKGDGHIFLIDLATEARSLHDSASYQVIKTENPLALVRRSTFDQQTVAILDRLVMLYPLTSKQLQVIILQSFKHWVRQALLLLSEERPHIHVRMLTCPYCTDEDTAHKIMMRPADFTEPDVYCTACKREWSFATSGLLGQYLQAVGL